MFKIAIPSYPSRKSQQQQPNQTNENGNDTSKQDYIFYMGKTYPMLGDLLANYFFMLFQILRSLSNKSKLAAQESSFILSHSQKTKPGKIAFASTHCTVLL